MAEQNPEQPAACSDPGAAPTAKVNTAAYLATKLRVWVQWRRLRRLAVTAALGIGVLVLAAFVSEAPWSNTRAARHVRLAGHDISRFDAAQIEHTIDELDAELARRKLHVQIAGQRFEVDAKSVAFRLDHRRTLEQALAEGRKGGIWARFTSFAARWLHAADVLPVAALEAQQLAALVEAWELRALPDRPSAGGIRIDIDRDRARALPVYPSAGRGVSFEVVRKRVLEALADPRTQQVELAVSALPAPLERAAVDQVVSLAARLLAGELQLTLGQPEPERRPAITITPAELAPALRTRRQGKSLLLEVDAAALRASLGAKPASIESEAVDAKFEVDQNERLSIVPSRSGLRIDYDKLPAVLLAASNSSRSGALPVLFEPLPKLSTEQAESLKIKGLVSSFTTRHPCCERRVDNIHHIANLLDGLVVQPGETVSLNTVVGPRTQKNGFVPAPTIEEGEMVETPGGGISQFATTMFNALFHGGYDIIERQPHTYWFPRYPMGHEATLSWPKPDLIFRNDTEAGLLIKTVYTDKSITVKLYGDNGGRRVRAEVSPRTSVTDPPIELVANPELEPNREKVKQSGAVGWSVIVSRLLTFPDGTTREEKRKVTYKPKPRRVEVHPCRIPKGEKGYTGERCPEPKDAEIVAVQPEPEP